MATCALIISVISSAQVDDPWKDIRPVPAIGVLLKPEVRKQLEDSNLHLKEAIDSLRDSLQKQNKPSLLSLLPDTIIFYNAVHYALTYNEFFLENETKTAMHLINEGVRRVEELAAGNPSWTTQAGLVVRGYVSKIDGSVQPYGIVVPKGFASGDGVPRRLDLWYHGRGENLSEVNFLNEHMH